MMKILSAIKNYMNYDINSIKKIERYLRLYRSKNKLKKITGKILYNRFRKKNSCNIYPTIDVGRNIYIAHPTNITLGETTELGSNIMIYPGVQLVSNFASDVYDGDRRHPRIEDNCILCVNSIIIGGVTVGRNTIIAAGAIVTHDVPENTVVTGVNQFRSNRYKNIDFLHKLSMMPNRIRIMFYDEKKLNFSNFD